MKTKKVEKTYYVDNGCIILFRGKHGIIFKEWTSLRTEPDLTYCHKITISWEEQEKKIEISESEWDRIAYLYADDMKMAKQKLFGGSND